MDADIVIRGRDGGRRHRGAGPAGRRRRDRRAHRRGRRAASTGDAGARRVAARSWRPASSTSTPTTTPRCSGTRRLTPSSLPRRHDGGGRQLRVLDRAGPPEHGVELLARTLQHVEDMSFDTLAAGVPWDDFETFPQYLDAVERRGVALNYGCYVGHTAVRLYVMGEEGYERPATDDELARMQAGRGRGDGRRRHRLRHQRVADPQRRPAAGRCRPGSPTSTSSDALLEPVRDAGRGVVALLPGGVFSNAEVFDLQRRGRPARSRGPRCSRSRASRTTRRSSRSTTRRGPTASRCGRRCRAARSCSR